MWRSSRSTEALALCLVLAAPLGGQEHRDPARYTRTEARYEPPDVTLIDAQGARVPLQTELAREGPVAVQLIFTTCTTVCPVLTGSAAAARAHLPGVRWISITIDPDEDTPERLLAYAARFQALGSPSSDWRFLTGRAEDLIAVQRAFDAFRGDKMRHEPLTLLRPAPGGPGARLQGFPTPADLAAEMKRLTGP